VIIYYNGLLGYFEYFEAFGNNPAE